MSDNNNDYANQPARTTIYRKSGEHERAVGYIDATGNIYKLHWDAARHIGRSTDDRRILRHTRYDERELGSFTVDGIVHSHGLFEGGELGWVELDGAVVQAGLIFGEEEVGRVEGNDWAAAGAALLLLFLPEEQEETNLANR